MTRDPSLTRRWARAVQLAVAAPMVSEGLDALLEEAVGATGSEGGALLETSGAVRTVRHRFPGARMDRLVRPSGPAFGALARVEEWLDDVLVLRPDDPEPGTAGEVVILAPLRVRELCTGALLLVFSDAVPDPVREAAVAFASVMALMLENDRVQEEARRAAQMREHFVTALNHELRTPANALLLNADLLRAEIHGEIPERLVRALREAEANARLMISVLRRVMDLGKLGDQAAPERTEVLHPKETVAELLRKMEPAAQRKNLALALYVPRNLPPLQSDPERFERILVHLLSNAVKYTTSGRVDVRLERSRRHVGPHRQEPTLVVRVTDTGRGIPPAQLERVFEPFAQVEEGARGDTGKRGAGLGLALARQLARSLRGDITMESRPGKGTTATLVLPYHAP